MDTIIGTISMHTVETLFNTSIMSALLSSTFEVRINKVPPTAY